MDCARLLILLLSLTVLAGHAYGTTVVMNPICPRQLRELAITQELRAARGEWQRFRFTSPESHDPKKYAYMLHSVDFKDTSPEDAAKSVSENPMLSCSLVTERRHATFEMAGFILDHVPENAYAASPEDFYSKNYLSSRLSAEEMEQEKRNIFQEKGLPSPTEIARKTQKGEYNEVLVDGRNGVRPSAVYLVAFKGKPLSSDAIVKKLREYATKNGLPVVLIEYETAD